MVSPDPGKLATVASIAANGSAGPGMLAAQNSALAGQQANALHTAAARAGAINAPQDFLKQQASMIAQPYNTASAQDTARMGALNGYLGALGNAQGNYMNELKAAIPLVQAQVDQAHGSNNLSQLIQLFNLKNSIADTQTKNDQLVKTKNDQATQQTALNSILNPSNPAEGNAAINIVNSAGNLPAAMSYLNSDQGKKDLAKLGVTNDTNIRRTLTQYYDPETYSQLKPIWDAQDARAAATSAPAPAPPKAKGPGVGDFLSSLLGGA